MSIVEKAKKRESKIRASIGGQFDKAIGQIIVSLFYLDTKNFNPKNRLSGYGELLRQFAIDDLMHGVFKERSVSSFSWFNDEGEEECLSRALLLHDDYKIATITHSYMQDNTLVIDVYTIVVYKNRGRIERFMKNQQPVVEEECCALLENIERAGYSFDEGVTLLG